MLTVTTLHTVLVCTVSVHNSYVVFKWLAHAQDVVHLVSQHSTHLLLSSFHFFSLLRHRNVLNSLSPQFECVINKQVVCIILLSRLAVWCFLSPVINKHVISVVLTIKIFFLPKTSGVTKSLLLYKEFFGFRGSCAKSDELPQVMSLLTELSCASQLF